MPNHAKCGPACPVSANLKLPQMRAPSAEASPIGARRLFDGARPDSPTGEKVGMGDYCLLTGCGAYEASKVARIRYRTGRLPRAFREGSGFSRCYFGMHAGKCPHAFREASYLSFGRSSGSMSTMGSSTTSAILLAALASILQQSGTSGDHGMNLSTVSSASSPALGSSVSSHST